MTYASYGSLAVLFTSLVSTTSLSAQQPSFYGDLFARGTKIRPLPLLVSESVQKEIELTDDQKAKVATVYEEFQAAVAKLRSATTAGRDLSELSYEQRTKWFEGIRKTNDDFEPKVKEILKPKQLERAQQIAYQVQGPLAFRNPDVIKALELTKDQQEKMEITNKDYKDKIQALGVDTAAFTKVIKLRDEQTAELAKVLTKEQTDKWMALMGKPFDVSTIRYGRPSSKPDDKKRAD